MELLHVLGNTYAAVAATALLPIYKLTDRDVVLIDTGYAKLVLFLSSQVLPVHSHSSPFNLFIISSLTAFFNYLTSTSFRK